MSCRWEGMMVMELRWKLIITELILGTLIELAPASLNTLEVMAQYVTDLSHHKIEVCIKNCNSNLYAQGFWSVPFIAPAIV